ncbi:MAG: enoyl-CoA hydratase/isomerase family protein [Ilumatobacteraceae bacterium]
MIAAVNGPVAVHSELAVLCDIVLCTPDVSFQDVAHFPSGLVPGDSMQVVWPMLLGPNRGRYFLLTGQSLHAGEALALGVVGEIVERDELLSRATQLASGLAARHPCCCATPATRSCAHYGGRWPTTSTRGSRSRPSPRSQPATRADAEEPETPPNGAA